MSSYDGPMLAAPRDASCIARPNVRGPKQVHVAVNVAKLAATYAERATLVGEAACDPGRMPLDMSLADRAERWPAVVRCRRRACASRWASAQASERKEP